MPFPYSKQALLEGLEIDQYIWGILENYQRTDCEEVTIDQHARVKPIALHTNPTVKEEPNDGGTGKKGRLYIE